MTRTRWACALAAAALLAAVGPGYSTAESLDKGTVEFSPNLSFSHQSVSFDGEHLGSLTQLQINGLIGYCVSNRLEVNGGLLVVHNSIDEDGGGSVSATAFGANAGLTVNFSTQGALVPFVRGTIGLVSYSGDGYEDADVSFLAPILTAGLRVMVGPSASVNLSANYTHHSAYGGVEDLSANEFGFGVGLSAFAGR